ncbi:MAG TPA: SDR family oxidoreductase, partial [Acidimicrobiales bacterium]|nr:SDR family oxidoreductase [Acidimicrobiales bacterium]
IVTGAGSGIGAATALRLGACGASVVLVGRRAEPLEAIAGLVREQGGKSLAVVADLAGGESPGLVTSKAAERFGRIDGLVNNAAIVSHHPIGDWQQADFDAHLAVNVRAPFFLIRDALPHLMSSPIRAIVNVSSSSGLLRLKGQSVYGMTKAALNYLSQSLAGELADRGVRINAIAPGPIDTPIHLTWASDLEEAYRWLGRQVPLGRIGQPDEIARWVELLLSPLSSFVTGAVIPVDGGQVIKPE